MWTSKSSPKSPSNIGNYKFGASKSINFFIAGKRVGFVLGVCLIFIAAGFRGCSTKQWKPFHTMKNVGFQSEFNAGFFHGRSFFKRKIKGKSPNWDLPLPFGLLVG